MPGDRRDLVSAVSNLVDNAIKYSERGSLVQVRVRSDDDVVEIAVIDEGVGIPARDMERIFERFYRVDRARSRTTGGTGLGLSIVRHVAVNHSGSVRVESREGSGSTFTLSLPAHSLAGPPAGSVDRIASSAVDGSPAEAVTSADRHPGEGSSVPDPPTVLVIEDEESFIEALVVGLKREGFLVTVARDGIEGIAMFDRVRPDLVLLDIWLPHKSGIDVCRELRLRTRVPIIMVTAKSSEIDTVVGLEVGADDYVTKPYRLRELVARMRAVLRRSPSADNGEPVGDVLEVGGLRLDPARHEVHLNGDQVPLPLKEFELLELLMGNAGRVLTRETLIDRIWGPHYVGDTKTLDVHVKRLRAKIEDDPGRPARITTIRGLGYKFEALRP